MLKRPFAWFTIAFCLSLFLFGMSPGLTQKPQSQTAPVVQPQASPSVQPQSSPAVQSQPAATPQLPQELKVATRVGVPPFVFEQEGQVVGFSVDLWKKIAEELGQKWSFAKFDNVDALLNAVDSKQADLGIAAISITSKREERFDFSYPIYESGLQIMVRAQGQAAPNFFAIIFSPALLQLCGIMAIVLLIPAHIIWWTERKVPDSGVSKSYFPGIVEACWWASATLATQADSMPKAALGRVVAIIWMFVSVVFVAYFTATVTSSLTVTQLKSSIQGINDLPGKRVITITNSTSAEYLKTKQLAAQEVTKIDEAYDALLNDRTDAIVFDAPVLNYYANHLGKNKVQVVGSPFRREGYGIVYQTQSPLRKRINEVLLRLQENGTYKELYGKWFGEQE